MRGCHGDRLIRCIVIQRLFWNFPCKGGGCLWHALLSVKQWLGGLRHVGQAVGVQHGYFGKFGVFGQGGRYRAVSHQPVAQTQAAPGGCACRQHQYCKNESPGHGYLLSGKGCPVSSEEHTSELQSLMRISYAVFCLKKKQAKKCK